MYKLLFLLIKPLPLHDPDSLQEFTFTCLLCLNLFIRLQKPKELHLPLLLTKRLHWGWAALIAADGPFPAAVSLCLVSSGAHLFQLSAHSGWLSRGRFQTICFCPRPAPTPPIATASLIKAFIPLRRGISAMLASQCICLCGSGRLPQILRSDNPLLKSPLGGPAVGFFFETMPHRNKHWLSTSN